MVWTDWRIGLLLTAGGALGSFVRFLLQANLNSSIPWGTFIANVVGSFAAGYLAAQLDKRPDNYVLYVSITGFCGGFTTFSALMLELFRYLESGLSFRGLVYLGVTLVLGLSMLAFGFRMGR